jgi:hypothetical protein
VGEILIKGPRTFQGYRGLEDETSESFDGDWFKTGDLGSLDDDGFLEISGRTKKIIVTSSGKNITTSISAKNTSCGTARRVPGHRSRLSPGGWHGWHCRSVPTNQTLSSFRGTCKHAGGKGIRYLTAE